MKNQNSSIAIITTVIIVVLLLLIIKLLRQIIHRHFPDTTTTTTTTPPSTLSSLPPPSPSPPPPRIIHSPPPQIRTHSLRFLFNNQISPQPNPQSDQHNRNLINSLPTFKFESIKGIRQSSSSISSSETTTATSTTTLDCAICISRFEKQDQLRLLPSCCHVFHSACIDQWIMLSNYSCPICRSEVKFVDDEDGDGELKMISSSARSFRIEIGSVSRSSRMEIGSFSASDLQNRSYSLGSFEYWVQDFDAEVFVELERINENRSQSDEVSVSVGGAAAGDVEEATEIVIEDPVRAESDEAASYARSLSYALQFSDRFYGGNVQRSGGDGGCGMDEGGCGGGGRVWDLEGNRFGEEISGFFGFLSRA
ncbi:hypothetical protein MKX03_019205 [Papaver bracteatum]|nr:hypothetical protein MKX03_019205 [Papaver bracteatum]